MENKVKQNKKRRLEGDVVSDLMNKTRVVEIVRFKEHPIYHKFFKVSTKFKAHDEKNQFIKGDRVIIEETWPISKDKKWKIVEKIGHNEVLVKESEKLEKVEGKTKE